jgi:hypothetical protein
MSKVIVEVNTHPVRPKLGTRSWFSTKIRRGFATRDFRNAVKEFLELPFYLVATAPASAMVSTMPLEACPKCGYAVAMIDHQCRHCSGLSRALPKFKKLDAPIVSGTILIAFVLSLLVYWAFFAH